MAIPTLPSSIQKGRQQAGYLRTKYLAIRLNEKISFQEANHLWGYTIIRFMI